MGEKNGAKHGGKRSPSFFAPCLAPWYAALIHCQHFKLPCPTTPTRPAPLLRDGKAKKKPLGCTCCCKSIRSAQGRSFPATASPSLPGRVFAFPRAAARPSHSRGTRPRGLGTASREALSKEKRSEEKRERKRFGVVFKTRAGICFCVEQQARQQQSKNKITGAYGRGTYARRNQATTIQRPAM